MTTVTSEAVSQWEPLVESVAQHYARVAERMAERSNGLFNSPAGAEFDDLVQVGLICVWKLLEAEDLPNKAPIINDMKDHLRVVFKQRGENV